MLIFDKISNIKGHLSDFRIRNKTIGFIPTMGALHKGHISLIENAKRDNNIVVCSIFVNPTQFNDKKDLEKYPRSPEKDKKMLLDSQCDVLFMPSIEEIYPSNKLTTSGQQLVEKINMGNLTEVLEGKHRPGHFKGVMQIVNELFEIVNPNNAYFGQKDFQQLVVIKRMVQQLNLPLNIVGCPIIRENDGLAMSSRNELLSQEERKTAPLIYQTLVKVKELSNKLSINKIKEIVKKEISKSKLIQLEYFEIVNTESLIPIQNFAETKEKIACIAVKLGNIRLIDNIILFP